MQSYGKKEQCTMIGSANVRCSIWVSSRQGGGIKGIAD